MKIFGPVLSVGKFHTEQEAIDLANDTTYGLAAGLHSSNRPRFCLPSQAHNHLSQPSAMSSRVFRSGGWNCESYSTLYSGKPHLFHQIWVNQYNVLYNNVPFGGKKQSGIGTCHHQCEQCRGCQQ